MKKVFLALLCLLLPACMGTKSLYKEANTPSQYVKVVLLHHNALGTEVVALRADPTVSNAVKDKLLVAYRVTVCSAAETGPVASCRSGPSYQLEAAGRAYEALQSAKTEADMQAALAQLVTLMTNLITIINGAK